MDDKYTVLWETYLRDSLQQLKLFHVIVPLHSHPVWHGFQTLPHLLWAAVNHTFSFVAARHDREEQGGEEKEGGTGMREGGEEAQGEEEKEAQG